MLIPRARLTMTDKPGYFLADLLNVQIHDQDMSGYVDARGGAGHLEDGPCHASLVGTDEDNKLWSLHVRLTKPLPEPGNLVALKLTPAPEPA